ncbi:MAG: hypothetical protein AB7Y46_05420 [Armatimonadota bacterium]
MRSCMLLAAVLACALAWAQDTNIAPAAQITTAPTVSEDRVPSILDGRVDTGFAFDVGTSGEGSVTLDFGAPRRVTGLRFVQHSAVYSTTHYIIEGDAGGDGEFELTLAEGMRAPVGEWIEHRWEPATVQVLRLRSLAGVSEGRRAHPALAEVEVFGPALPGDATRAAQLGNPVSTISVPRPLRHNTPLTVAGKVPRVVAGNDAPSRAAAQALATGLAAALGREVPVVASIDEAGLGERTVLAVGTCVTNPLIARLYHNWYALEDSLYPGPGGYTLRTVTDPYPWRGDVDVIVLGGSDTAGLAAGVQRLLALVGDEGELPWLLEVVSNARPTPEQVRAATAQEPAPTFAAFLDAVTQWQRWGDEAWARRAMRALDIMVQTYQADPARDIPWNEETRSGPIFAAWEVFEACPLLDDAQRLAYSRAMLSLLYSIPQHVSGYANLESSELVTWNHTTFPLLGLYFGGRHFGHYHHISVCEEYLAKAHACFRAQARSWKPQEDADSYITATMEHAIRYCLAEGLDEFVTGGNMARYADYMIGICDSRGWASGFGDSGYSSNPRLLQEVLPIAFLTTGDPSYRWVLEHVDPGWENPYQDIPGERPDRFVGLNVFPLDAQLYEYTQRYPYYNERLVPSEVPLQRAWDKIAMRESWEPDAQYLLMDGFGRGKHLHYDTNAIIEYVADGERWLVDHDYLVRNSTEHCMLTVLRDGRGETLVPSMAALDAAADFDHWSVVRTSVPGYAGLNWDRTVVWRKGRYFVVLDGVSAREQADYDLELTWKTEDMHAQWVEDGRSFIADRSAAVARSADVFIQDDADASGGKAVVFGSSTSRLAVRVPLPGGEYLLQVRGRGEDGSHDSVWVRIDGGDPIGFGLGQGGYNGPVGGGPAPGASHAVTLPPGDVHLLLVTLRELPPISLDRLTFYRDEEAVLSIEAEEAEPLRAGESISAEPKHFVIRSAEPAQCRATTHQSQGISVPLAVLHQRQRARLSEGEGARFASILYSVNGRRTGEYDLGRVGPARYLVSGDDRALIALDELQVGALTCRAQVAILEAGRVVLAGATQIQAGAERWSAEEPASVVLDLGDGRLTVNGAPARALPVTAADRAAAERLLGAEPETVAAEGAAAAEPTEPRWRAQFPEPGPIRRLQRADLDGDGVPEILVAQGRWCHCLSLSGELLWSWGAEGAVLDLADVQARDDAGRQVALASADTHIYLLSATGELLDTHQPLGPPHSQTFGDRPWQLWVVDGMDIDGDGLDELFTVMDNYEFIALDQNWTRLWSYTQVAHGAMDIAFADWDGDGADEVFVSDRYGYVHGVTRDGKRAFIGYSSIGDVQFDLARLTPDGLSVVYGSSTGDLLTRGPDGGIAWRFDNFGYAVRRIRAADIAGDATPEVLIASDTGYLYAVDASGAEIWRAHVGFAANDVVVADIDGDGAAEVLAASEDGAIRVFAGDGSVRGPEIVTSGPARLLCVPTPGADAPLVVATGAGEVAAY